LESPSSWRAQRVRTMPDQGITPHTNPTSSRRRNNRRLPDPPRLRGFGARRRTPRELPSAASARTSLRGSSCLELIDGHGAPTHRPRQRPREVTATLTAHPSRDDVAAPPRQTREAPPRRSFAARGGVAAVPRGSPWTDHVL
jgi:hypothetical protein